MSSETYKPRFTFEVSEEQFRRASNLLSNYGVRKAVFGKILDDVLDMIEEHGGIAIGVLMAGHVKPRDIIPSIHEVETYKKVKPKKKKEGTDG